MDILITFDLLASSSACKAIEVVAKALDRAAGRDVDRHVHLALDEASETVGWEDEAVALGNEERTPVYEGLCFEMWERQLRGESA